jgi:hypothetical protein
MRGICRNIALSFSIVALLAAPVAAAQADASQSAWFAGYVFRRLAVFGILVILGGIWGYFKGLVVRPAKTKAERELEAEAEAEADRYRY